MTLAVALFSCAPADRRYRGATSGLLAGSSHVFARVLASALPQDWEELWARRRDEDREELISHLEIGLVRAATPRGIDGARRRFLADLLALRRKHGPQARDLWDQVKSEGEAMVRDRLGVVA